MPHGQDVVRIESLARPREQLCDHTCTKRALTRRERLAACVRRWPTVQLQQRRPVRTRSEILASAATQKRHRQGPTARCAGGLTTRCCIRRRDHQRHVPLRLACCHVGALCRTGRSCIARRLRHDRFATPGARRDHAVIPRQWIVRRWHQRTQSREALQWRNDSHATGTTTGLLDAVAIAAIREQVQTIELERRT